MRDRADLAAATGPGCAEPGRHRGPGDDQGRRAGTQQAAGRGRPGGAGRRGRAGRARRRDTLRAVAGLPAARPARPWPKCCTAGCWPRTGPGCVVPAPAGRRAVYEAIAVPERRALHRRAGMRSSAAHPSRSRSWPGITGRPASPPSGAGYAEQTADLALSAGDEATAITLLLDLLTERRPARRRGDPAGEQDPVGSFTNQARFQTSARCDPSWTAEPWTAGRGRGPDAARPGAAGEDERAAGRAEVERAIPYLAGDPAEAARAMTLLGWPTRAWPAQEHRQWLQRAARTSRPRCRPMTG